MGIMITLSKVQLIRESCHRYGDIASRHISDSDDAARLINAVLELENEAQEILGVLFLDNRNKVTGIMEVSRGSTDSTVAMPREIFKGAILHNAARIILFHNHTSGETKPSQEDLVLTKRIAQAGDLLGIPLLDHIIIGHQCHTSMKEANLF